MKYIFTLLFTLYCFISFGQQFSFVQRNDVKVVIGPDTLRQPWMGGLNAPVFSTIKLNNDATEDLYVFDRNTKKSYTFLAENVNGNWRWKYAPEYETLFPKNLEYWVLLRDFDGDGRKDLFTGNNNGTWLYENQTAANGRLNFKAPRPLRVNTGAIISLGSYILPALTDIDNDGDMDILAFDSTAATTITYFKNRSVEMGYLDDSLKFTRELQRWGRLSRCGVVCNAFEFGTNICRAAAPLHGGGASILALDLDGDLDKDILVGADMCPDLVRLTNKGTTALAEMDSGSLSTTYPIGTTAASIINFPAAYYEDVNFDGKKDLLVSPFLADNLDNANFTQSVWLYHNNATSAAAPPVFAYQKNNFLQDQMIDMGRDAMPAFADIDADGDLDMLVGNYADYRTGATQYRSAVSLFTNVGSALKPVYKLTDPDYLQFSQANVKGIHLQFADMNNDGSLDLIIKFKDVIGTNANIAYIPNAAQPNQPFSFSRANQVLLGLDINATDSPYFYDLDNDGDLDLLLGTQKIGFSSASGAIHYIKRVGANPVNYSSWQLFNDNFGQIARLSGREHVCPVIADVDHNNQADLITSDDSGVLRIYPNALANPSAALTSYSAILPNNLLGTTLETDFGPALQISATDLDNDQKPEIVVGTGGGGLLYLKNNSQPLGISEALEQVQVKVFPNPASSYVKVTARERIQVALFNATGQELLQSNGPAATEQELDLINLKPGIYFLKMMAEGFRSAGRTLVIQR